MPKLLAALAAALVAAVALLLLWDSDPPPPPTVEFGWAEDDRDRPGRATQQGGAVTSREEVSGDPGSTARVYASIVGRVVDSGGHPVANARVELTVLRYARPRFQGRAIPKPVITDGSGQFRFRGETWTDLRVQLDVRHDRFAPTTVQRDASPEDGTVALGDIVLERGGDVTGRVVDELDRPIAGATLTFQPGRNNPIRRARDRGALGLEVESDGNGAYRIRGLTAGTWRIRASAMRHQERYTREFAVEADGLVQMEPLVLPTGSSLQGQVWNDRNEPVAQAQVRLRGASDGQLFRTQTDDDGRFGMDHLSRDTFEVSIDSSGYLELQEIVDPEATPERTFVLNNGLVLRGIVQAQNGGPVTLFAARPRRLRGLDAPGADQIVATLTQRREALQEQLRRATQLPGSADVAARAQRLQAEIRNLERSLAAARDGNSPFNVGGRSPFASHVENPSEHPGGVFEFAGLKQGIYVVDVSAPNYQKIRSEEIELRVGERKEVTVLLPKGLEIRGTVEAPDGRAVAGAEVRLQSETGTAGRRWTVDRTRSEQDGSFAFPHAPPGNYSVIASTVGFADARSGTFPAGTTNVLVTLQGHATLRGVVRGDCSSGEVRVSAFAVNTDATSLNRNRRGNAKAGTDGSYLLEGLAPGTYVVRATQGAPSRREWSAAVRAVTRGEAPADVVLESGAEATFDPELLVQPRGNLRGTVRMVTGTATGLLAELFREGPGGGPVPFSTSSRRMAVINPDGRFAMDGLDVGSYRITVRERQNRVPLWTQPVVITEGGTATVTATISVGGIVGEVRSADGKPVNGWARLHLGVTTPPPEASALRAGRVRIQDGRFATDAVPLGTVCVEVQVDSQRRGFGVVQVQGPKTPISIDLEAPR